MNDIKKTVIKCIIFCTVFITFFTLTVYAETFSPATLPYPSEPPHEVYAWDDGIEIIPPNKTVYAEGEILDLTGFEVYVTSGIMYSDGTSKITSRKKYIGAVVDLENKPLTVNDKCVTVTIIGLISQAPVSGTFEITVNQAVDIENEYTYKIENGEAVITAIISNAETLDIPSELGGCSVTKISYDANLSHCEQVLIINIPESVKVINNSVFAYGGAFSNCSNLKTVNIGAGVEKIGGILGYYWEETTQEPTGTPAPGLLPPYLIPFEGCTNLEQINVSSENNVFSSEDGVLFTKDKTKLVLCPFGKSGSYIVPEFVKALDMHGFISTYSPFNDCTKLTELVLSDNIDGETGAGMLEGLKKLYLGSGISSCNFTAPNLQEINVGEKNKNLSSIAGVLFSKDKEALIQFPRGRLGKYSIPDGTKEIRDHAFRYCIALSEIYIPDSVTEIANTSFYNCSSDLTIVSSASAYAHQYAMENEINWKKPPSVDVMKYFHDYAITLNDYPCGDGYVYIALLYAKSTQTYITDYKIGNLNENSIYVDLKGEANNSCIKVFAWDSLDSMRPLCEPFVYNLRDIDFTISRDTVEDKPITITMRPSDGVQIYDYVDMVNRVGSYDDGNDGNGGYTLEDIYHFNVKDYSQPVEMLGNNTVTIYKNGRYIFHGKDRGGNDIYQEVEIDRITRPIIDCSIHVNDDNISATSTLNIDCNKNAGYPRIAIKSDDHPVNGSALSIEYYVKTYVFENPLPGTIILDSNEVKITKNGAYQISCLDSWGNVSRRRVIIDCIPKVE